MSKTFVWKMKEPHVDIDSYVTATAEIGLNWQLSCGVGGYTLHLPWPLPDIDVPSRAWLRVWVQPWVNVTLDAKAHLNASYHNIWTKNLFKLDQWGAIPLPLGFAYLWIDLHFSVDAYLRVDADGNITVTYSYSTYNSLKVGFDASFDTGRIMHGESPLKFDKIWEPYQERHRQGPNIDIKASVTVRGGVSGTITAPICGLAGPYATLEIFAKLGLTYQNSDTVNWRIDIGITLEVGVSVGIELDIYGLLSVDFTWSRQIFKDTLWGMTLASGTMKSHPIPNPTADFTCRPYPAKPLEKITLDGSTSQSPEQTISKYDWDINNNNNTHTYLSGKIPSLVSFTRGGYYAITLKVTTSPYGNESSETQYIHVLKREISVSDIVVSTNETYLGLPVQIKFCVSNMGETDESNVNVSIIYASSLTGIEGWTLENLTVYTSNVDMWGNPLAGSGYYINHGVDLVIRYTWNSTLRPTTVGRNYPIYVVVGGKFTRVNFPTTYITYPMPLAGESDTTNNNCRSRMPVHLKIAGDINGDKSVNILDVVAVTRCYGAWEFTPTYQWPADVRRDGKIDILDVVIVTGHYGEKEQSPG
jgi:hypothetical protein